MKSKSISLCAITLVALLAGNVAAQVSVPHEFQAGQPARAIEVNENFDALEAAIDQNTGELEQIRGTTSLSREAKQIQTGLDLTSGLRWLVTEFYVDRGVFPGDNASIGASASSTWSNRFVASAIVRQGGVIAIVFGPDAAPQLVGREILLTPTDPGSGTVWFDCSGDGVTDQFVAELDCAFSDEPVQPLHSIRRQILTAFDLLEQSNAEQLIQDFYNTNAVWPSSNAQAGLGAPDTYRNHYITGMTVSGDGVITMTYGGWANFIIRDATITWTPEDNGNSIQWRCLGGVFLGNNPIYLPAVCRP